MNKILKNNNDSDFFSSVNDSVIYYKSEINNEIFFTRYYDTIYTQIPGSNGELRDTFSIPFPFHYRIYNENSNFSISYIYMKENIMVLKCRFYQKNSRILRKRFIILKGEEFK